MDKKEQMRLISYFTMGDGCIFRQPSKTDKGYMNGRFIMNMLEEHRDYMEEFRDLVDFTKVSIKERKDYNTDGCKRKPQLRMESGNHPKFTKLHERIYSGKYKGLDPIYIPQIDWHCLAILYQADGSLGESFRPEIGMKNPSYSVALNLKRLSYGDLDFLRRYLFKNLGLHWTINRHNKYYYLRLRMKSFKDFMEGISPYIHESFNYKIRTIDPAKAGGEIFCSAWEHAEADRNDQPTHESVE